MAEEENEFYRALEAGDTSVIDTGIYEKQKRIDELRRKLLSSLSVLSVCMLLAGCTIFRDPPVRETPKVTVEALTEDERSYVVNELTVEVDGEAKTLENRYLVSADFIRTFRRNQDTTLEALEALQSARRWMLPIGLIAFAAGAVFMRFARR